MPETITIKPVFFPMSNVIQNYAWGSTTSITQLFGIENPHGEPQAEIWMGAHPNGCSTVVNQAENMLLSSLINTDLPAYLGDKTADTFGELPYLFKVLCAEKALSIQVHPNKQQAEIGFAREERQGIAHNSTERNYKDPNHKPELVYALTPYQAMNGFRSIAAIIDNFTQLEINTLSTLIEALKADQSEQGLTQFFTAILSLDGEAKQTALEGLMAFAKQSSDPLFGLLIDLESQYPGDIGLFAPLMLNVLTLQPGEAMFLDAETPHAYIKGSGLEIMANSDNVLRAGLTPKYMDIPELVSCTRFVEMPFESLLLAPSEHDGVLEYAIPVADFKFAVILSSTQRKISSNSAEILLPLDSKMVLNHTDGSHCEVEKGQSVFIPAYASEYTIDCEGRVARAYC